MPDIFDEAARQLEVCNACRYCEGYCPVWPAMERRNVFDEKTSLYLANLCHDCRACYYACPFIPPHEINLNIPQLLSDIRVITYKDYTRPRILSRVFERQARYGTMLAAVSILAVFALTLAIGSPSRLFAVDTAPDSFYALIPYYVLVVCGLAAGLFVLVSWILGMNDYWKDIRTGETRFWNLRAIAGAVGDALGHKWFEGGGAGCDYPTEGGNTKRLVLHLLLVAGFLLDVVSTILAYVYQDGLHIQPPYAFTSLPVLFGLSGGIGILLGATGLLYLKRVSDKSLEVKPMIELDYLFLYILDATALTGVFTLFLRSTPLLGVTFTLHIGLVLALFLTAPYGKFVHSIYRFVAMVNNRLEESSSKS